MPVLKLTDLAKKLRWQITDGSKYEWKSYGLNCRHFDFRDEDNTWCIEVVADVLTTEVIEVSGHGRLYSLVDTPWKWIDADYLPGYLDECKTRKLRPYVAWDDVNYHMIESSDDVLRMIGMV